MARTAQSDVFDKFRFQVTFLKPTSFKNKTLSDVTLASENTLLGTQVGGTVSIGNATLSRAGFSEITLPRGTHTEIAYRENIGPPTFNKQAGLLRYEPITLRRGAMVESDLYYWFTAVNDNITSISLLSSALSVFSIPPTQETNYRADIVVSIKGRDGKFAKHFILFNCFPISFKAGDDLNSLQDQKLLEEVVLSYETVFESAKESLVEALKEANFASIKAAQNSTALGAIFGSVNI